MRKAARDDAFFRALRRDPGRALEAANLRLSPAARRTLGRLLRRGVQLRGTFPNMVKAMRHWRVYGRWGVWGGMWKGR